MRFCAHPVVACCGRRTNLPFPSKPPKANWSSPSIGSPFSIALRLAVSPAKATALVLVKRRQPKTMSLRPHSRSGRIHPEAITEDVAAPVKRSRSLKRTGSAVTGAAYTSSDVGSWSRSASIRRSHVRVLSRQEIEAEEEEAKKLNASDEEHAAWLAERVRLEGRQKGLDLLRFYCRMLLPVAYTTAIFFGVFASLSYAIPNVLCNKVAKENSVRAAVVQQGRAWTAGIASPPRFASHSVVVLVRDSEERRVARAYLRRCVPHACSACHACAALACRHA